MRIEYHLLALSHVSTDKHHPAIAKPNMSDRHSCCHAVKTDNLLAPVKLIRLTS
ncbi:hypothetical protein Brsp05_04395 [Brucella sp. NBRC 12953]